MNSTFWNLARFGIFVVLIGTPGCVPTISMHSYRNVDVTITKAGSGQPVASLPFRVVYDYNAVDSPVAYHLELRTPRKLRAQTDDHGRAVVKLADYAWDTRVEFDADEGYTGVFWLNKKLIRKGGAVEQSRYPYPDLPKLKLELNPVPRPKQSGANGRQLFNSDTNQTLLPVASHRSP